MVIKGIFIDGFGKWYDKQIDLSADSFVCIYGENESGKSTLKAFILFVLFGMPPKQRSFYQPKTGAKMGGRLLLFMEGIGEVTVERYDGKLNGAAVCLTSDGRQYDEMWLKQQLKGMTSPAYQSIFSFSAMDLAAFQRMGEDDLSDVLLSIGLTGSKNIYEIEKQLDVKLQALFRPTGKKPAINKQLTTLNLLQQQMTASQKEASCYREKTEALYHVNSEIHTLKGKIQGEKEALAIIEKKQQALPFIGRYHQYQKKGSELPGLSYFPENGLSRHREWKEKILPLKSEFAVAAANIEKYSQKQNEQKQTLLKAETKEQIVKMLEAGEKFKEAEKEQISRTEKQRKKKIQIEHTLNELNLDISADDLSAIGLPAYMETEWNQLKTEKEQLDMEYNRLQDEAVSNQQTHAEIKAEKDRLQQEVLSKEEYERLTKIVRMHEQNTYIKTANDRNKDWKVRKRKKKQQAVQMFWVSIILAAAICTLAFITSISWLYAAGGLLIAGGIGQWAASRSSIKEMEQFVSGTSVEQTAQADSTVTYMEAERLLSNHYVCINKLDSLQDRLKSLDIQSMQLDERTQVVHRNKQRAEDRVEEYTCQFPFLKNIPVTYWPAYYHPVKQLMKLFQELDELECQKRQSAGIQDKYKADLFAFIAEENLTLAADNTLDQLKKLKLILDENTHTADLVKQYDVWIEEEKERQLILKQKIAVYEKEINHLYKHAAVKDEEGFIQQANIWQEIKSNKVKLTETTDQLRRIFTDKQWDQIKHEVLDEKDLNLAYESHKNTQLKLETKLEENRQFAADIHAELANMESSETYSMTLHHLNMEQEQLTRLAHEWKVLKAAKGLLYETKQTFRDKYLQKVIEKAAHYFNKLTKGKYKRVHAPENGQLFRVTTEDNVIFTVNELSKGTADQLYIALRIAISEIMSDSHHLPFIIDDAFVHFDTVRINEMLAIVKEIAKKQQVIVFTCKQDIISSIETVNIIHLNNSVRIN